MALPGHVKYLIIGAGIHGLSTAYHLASALKAKGNGAAADILVVDKTDIAAGASGIACGVVRNNYYQPAMRELMAACVEEWETDPEAYHYHPVGYMQISPESMRSQIAEIAEQQRAIGYESEFIEGEAESARYMRGLFSDWQAPSITSVLHEKKGGYANNKASMLGLADKAKGAGARILTGVEVKGFGFGANSKAVTSVETDQGSIDVDQVIVAVGPWVPRIWEMLDLPERIDVKDLEGTLHRDVDMWRFWCLEEGTLAVEPSFGMADDGSMPPVIHVDSDEPLYSDVDGRLITDEMWGIYYKPDFNFGGIQGGAAPYKVKTPVPDVAIDPYGPESPEFVVDAAFKEMWCSALALCQSRYKGQIGHWLDEPSGGIGAFTADSFPVFDRFRENCYVIADSNHGYKMLAVGKLVADELLGRESALLEPFRFSRFAEGRLHPVSNSPFPWS
ncbi:MAG: FAD-binding oxidoreductase [Rhodospirillales bacterium]|nr:FAD-binding oxidoreductase [Rhodospirillales bacterium]